MIKEINQLKNILWSGPAYHSKLLTDFGLPHRFGGAEHDQPADVFLTRQEHGIQLIEVLSTYNYRSQDTSKLPVRPDQGASDRPIADGQHTSTPGQPVAVRTADCLPVLLADTNHTMVAAIHAGWRGLTSGIIKQAVNILAKRGIASHRMIVAIGPAIGRENYEVGDDVVDAASSPHFGLSANALALCVSKGKGDRWKFDLSCAAALSLVSLGIIPQNIEVIQACTHNDQRWHSYRRDRQQRGSNWSWVSLPASR